MTILELQRAIAAHPRWKWLPGMACRDPEMGTVWRRFPAGWGTGPDWMGDDWIAQKERESNPATFESAIAAGPDLTDAATWGAMLGLLPEGSVMARYGGDPWRCLDWSCCASRGVYVRGDTPGEAVGHAMLNWMEVAK